MDIGANITTGAGGDVATRAVTAACGAGIAGMSRFSSYWEYVVVWAHMYGLAAGTDIVVIILTVLYTGPACIRKGKRAAEKRPTATD